MIIFSCTHSTKNGICSNNSDVYRVLLHDTLLKIRPWVTNTVSGKLISEALAYFLDGRLSPHDYFQCMHCHLVEGSDCTLVTESAIEMSQSRSDGAKLIVSRVFRGCVFIRIDTEVYRRFLSHGAISIRTPSRNSRSYHLAKSSDELIQD